MGQCKPRSPSCSRRSLGRLPAIGGGVPGAPVVAKMEKAQHRGLVGKADDADVEFAELAQERRVVQRFFHCQIT